MDAEKRGWPWWKKLLTALAVPLLALLGLFFGLRRAWIEPLPGVRVEPTRPVMAQRDFGPESPYLRLLNLLVDIADHSGDASVSAGLLMAVGRSPWLAPPDSSEPVAELAWWWPETRWWPDMPPRRSNSATAESVLQKLRHFPWPTIPPPPAPVPEPLYVVPSATPDSEDPFSAGSGGSLDATDMFRARDMFVGGETFGGKDRFGFKRNLSGRRKYALGMQEEGMPGRPLLDARTGEPVFRTPHAAFATEAPWNLEQYRHVRRILELYEPFLPRLDSILADPAARMPSIVTDDHFSDRDQIDGLFQWLAVAAEVKADSGDWDGAFLCIGRIQRLAEMRRRGGGRVNHSEASTAVGTARESVWRIARRYPVPGSVLRQAARDILAHADAAEPYVEAVRTDWLWAKSHVHDIYRHTGFAYDSGKRELGIVKLRYFYAGVPPVVDPKARYAFVFLAPLMGSTLAASTGNLQAYFQHLVVLAEQPYSARLQAEYERLQALRTLPNQSALWLGTRDPVGRILVAEWADRSSDVCIQRAFRECMLRGLVLFLSLRAYELEHGGVPETLDALVPDYLPRIPEDPFDGQPFRYLPRAVPGLPPEAWAVYSIGADFVDDGGKGYDKQIAGNAFSPYRRSLPELVFPSQPYPPERERRRP